MTENIGAQFKVEGQPAFPIENKENDNSSASPTGEKTNIDQTPSSAENKNQTENKTDDTNLADHPRWKERENDWTNRFNSQEVRHTNEIAELRKEMEVGLKSRGPKSDFIQPSLSPVPSWFGGDENQWAEFQSWNNGLIGKAKEEAMTEALKEIQSRSAAEQKAIDDATTYMNNEVTSIEADKTINPEGQKVDRNKLLKFVLDEKLVDTEGKWNYRAAFKMMKAQDIFKAKEVLNEKKQIASATTSENRAESKPKEFKTSADFQKLGSKPW